MIVTPTVNYHLPQACNIAYGHCFATCLPSERWDSEDSTKLIVLPVEEGFEKINFAGGEPLLHPKLDRLIRVAKWERIVIPMVTISTLIDCRWLDYTSGHLDLIVISVDGADQHTYRLIGRAANCLSVSMAHHIEMSRIIRERSIRLKANTVINLHNHAEDMTALVESMKPKRKIMQALPIQGQNDHNADTFEVTNAQFGAFCERNQTAGGTKMVFENNHITIGRYAMVDPLRRFFDNTKGTHTYSQPILEVGVDEALKHMSLHQERFVNRGGRYE